MLAIDSYPPPPVDFEPPFSFLCEYFNQPIVEDDSPTLHSTATIGEGKWFHQILKLDTSPWEGNKYYTIYINENPVKIELPPLDNQESELTKTISQENSITFVDRLGPIKEQLALSVTQLAELFGVTRKSIYDWYDGKEPRSSTEKRLEILTEALRTIPDNADLKRLKVVWNIPLSGKSFREVYNNTLDDETLLNELQKKLAELSPKLIKKNKSRRKSTTTTGENHFIETDRHADFS